VSDQTLRETSRGTFNETVGIELDSADLDEGVIRGHVEIGAHLLQPFGIVHGGVYATIAETVASAGTWLGVRENGMVAMGQSNNTSFLRPAGEGMVRADGHVRHRGRTTWIWDVDCTVEGKLVATSRVTIAVRPAT
jgi:1,4-dihydroxy-2-naphthoyl-CoA hydrolase